MQIVPPQPRKTERPGFIQRYYTERERLRKVAEEHLERPSSCHVSCEVCHRFPIGPRRCSPSAARITQLRRSFALNFLRTMRHEEFTEDMLHKAAIVAQRRGLYSKNSSYRDIRWWLFRFKGEDYYELLGRVSDYDSVPNRAF